MKKIFFSHIIAIVVIIAGILACQNAGPPASAERLYSVMTRQNVVELSQFPPAFAAVENKSTGIIFTSKRDTLRFVCSYPAPANRKDHYPFYVIQDNHNHYWTLIQKDPDKYEIYRLNDAMEKHYFKSFCASGASLLVIGIFVIVMMVVRGDEEKKKPLDPKTVAKILVGFFLLGGIIGLCLA